MADNKFSTPTKANGKAAPEPSPQEARFFFSIIKNMTNKPEIDWDAVAQDSGFKNGKVAIVRDLPEPRALPPYHPFVLSLAWLC